MLRRQIIEVSRLSRKKADNRICHQISPRVTVTSQLMVIEYWRETGDENRLKINTKHIPLMSMRIVGRNSTFNIKKRRTNFMSYFEIKVSRFYQSFTNTKRLRIFTETPKISSIEHQLGNFLYFNIDSCWKDFSNFSIENLPKRSWQSEF